MPAGLPQPELLDVIDEHGAPTGEVLPREEIYRRGLWKRCIQVWFVNDRSEILLQRRSKNKRTAKLCWDTSVAGHVPHGEDTRTTTSREIQEKIGITVTADELIPFGEFLIRDYDPFGDRSFVDNERNDVFIVHRSFNPNECTLQASEVAEVRWFTPDEFERGVREHPEQFTARTKRELFDRIIAYARDRAKS